MALAVAAGALAQSVSGIGFALVCGPLLVVALGPADGVGLAVALSLLVNLAVLARSARRASLRDALLLAVPALLATPLLVRALERAPERLATSLAGAATVAGALALAVGLRWRRAAGRCGAVAAGLLSAAMNVVAGIGGPAVALYAANAGWPADAMRSTGQVYFLLLNVVALAALGLPDVSGRLAAACLAALGVGLLAGGPIAARVPEQAARRTTLALAALGGLVVLARAVLGGVSR